VVDMGDDGEIADMREFCHAVQAAYARLVPVNGARTGVLQGDWWCSVAQPTR
jgi:hypothetical protein